MMKEPKRIELSASDADALVERLKAGRLQEKDCELLCSVVNSWMWLCGRLQDAKVSIRELKKLVFGAKTEKTSKVLKKAKPGKDVSAPKPKPKGHGRNGANAYTGAERIHVCHPELCAGHRCPECVKGKLYEIDPREIVCITGQPPIGGKVYVTPRLRCNLCGTVFNAPCPPEAAGPKYDSRAKIMIALLHYGNGLPFNRLEQLQGNVGIPLPRSTQWDLVNEAGKGAVPAVFDQLCDHAAGGEVFHNDDTNARVLELEKQIAQELEACRQQGSKDCRTGVFTTGIVCEVEGRHVALFFTGRQHAGENLNDVLERRADHLSAPIQMCDALSRNAPKDFKTLLANCLCHGRREFVKIIEDFPEHCRHVLETLREVFKNDAVTKKQAMSKEQRLAYHQQHSEPIMKEFLRWLNTQIEEKRIEPNSKMGKAISYMTNHWKELTLFLRVPGAPLDNNVVERALKAAIRYRNNSLFYKTERGAEVGDMFMSLIHTCRLCRQNAFEYLTAIMQHAEYARRTPEEWMPWNFRKALAICESTA